MARAFILIPLLVFLLFGCAPPPKAVETIFYPELPLQPRIQFLTSITNEADIGKRAGGLDSFLLGDVRTSSLNRIYDVTSRPGRLYISDIGYKMVLIVDFAKKEIRPLETSREATLRQPHGLTVADGYLYVTDGERRQVLAFDAEDQFVRIYGGTEILQRPMDVAVFGDRVYVSDFTSHEIKVFDRESTELIQTIGGRGQEDGQFDRPGYLTVDQQGNLYVNDSHNFRYQKFDAEGNFVYLIGYAGSTPGGFARPKGFDVSRNGFIYAVDAAFENVQVFMDENQLLVYFFGGFGNAPSFIYLPSALTIDYDNVDRFKQYVDKDFEVEYLIYVANQLGDYKLNVYGFGKWIGKPLN